jgi:hypothetical protein
VITWNKRYYAYFQRMGALQAENKTLRYVPTTKGDRPIWQMNSEQGTAAEINREAMAFLRTDPALEETFPQGIPDDLVGKDVVFHKTPLAAI